jgi:hypothetical protein
MPARETFCFHGYRLRPVGLPDLSLATEWTKADPYHCDTTSPSFWIEQERDCDSYMLEDNIGPIFFFKMQRTSEAHIIEFHIQFPPPEERPSDQSLRNRRVMTGLVLGLEWIERVLLFSGVKEVFFKSQSPTLIRFCLRRLGFEHDGEFLTKRIDTPSGKGSRICAEPVHSNSS